MDLEKRLKKLNSLKDKIDIEIEDVQDKIHFSFQKEKTDVAQKRLNKWYRTKTSFVKIFSITGNTYKSISITHDFTYFFNGVIFSRDYYPKDYKKCSKEEIKQIQEYFDRIK
jgi:hypothetical protein